MKASVQTPKKKQPTLEERMDQLEKELVAQRKNFDEFSLSVSRTLTEQREEIVKLRGLLDEERKLRHIRQQNALEQMNK